MNKHNGTSYLNLDFDPKDGYRMFKLMTFVDWLKIFILNTSLSKRKIIKDFNYNPEHDVSKHSELKKISSISELDHGSMKLRKL